MEKLGGRRVVRKQTAFNQTLMTMIRNDKGRNGREALWARVTADYILRRLRPDVLVHALAAVLRAGHQTTNNKSAFWEWDADSRWRPTRCMGGRSNQWYVLYFLRAGLVS